MKKLLIIPLIFASLSYGMESESKKKDATKLVLYKTKARKKHRKSRIKKTGINSNDNLTYKLLLSYMNSKLLFPEKFEEQPKPFKCNQCNFKSTHQENVRRHLIRRHLQNCKFLLHINLDFSNLTH